MNNITLFQQKIRALAASHMSGDGAHDIRHLDRVWHNARLIIENDNLLPDVLVVCAACYLHDIKQYKKDDALNHKSSRIAAEFAQKLITENFKEITQEQLEKINHAIAAHSYSAKIKALSLEAKIVQDADRLDSLGAIGIARLFYTAGIIGTALYSEVHHELDDKKYAVDHFHKKINKLQELMNTAYAKKLALIRLDFVSIYLKQLETEGVPVYPENLIIESKDSVPDYHAPV